MTDPDGDPDQDDTPRVPAAGSDSDGKEHPEQVDEHPIPTADASTELGVLVDERRTEAVITALRAEGVYDESRAVADSEGDTVVVPVTDPPETVEVLDVVQQVTPQKSPRTLAEHLERRGWSETEIEKAPSSWAVLGTVILLTVPEDCPDETAVGEALLSLHGEADTVLARDGIDGPQRTPNHRVIAGIGDTETVHTEHGTRYAMDLSTVMFSPGNEGERARLGAAVAAGANRRGTPRPPEEGLPPDDPAAGGSRPESAEGENGEAAVEHVFDMFAGIGYFTLPMARAGARVTATEINPDSFRYLIENVRLNGVEQWVAPYRADCRDVAAGVEADRVLMGHYDAHEYLDAAFDAVVPGGLLHYHEATPDSELWDRPLDRLETAADRADLDLDIEGKRRVKWYSEGVAHVVVDARVLAE